MKKSLILLTLILNVGLVNSQSRYDEQHKVFDLALQFNDISNAKFAVYQMMAMKPQNQLGLLDTLSMLFYSDNDFQNCVKATSLLIKKNPEKLSLYEMRGKSLQRLGFAKESLSDYEVLYSKTKKDVFLYEILVSQYQLKRFGEAEQSANTLLLSTNDTLSVDVQLAQSRYQKVPLKAAVYNIKGVVAQEVSQPEVAKKMFENALKVDPKFVLPKNNLQIIANNKLSVVQPVKVDKVEESTKKHKR